MIVYLLLGAFTVWMALDAYRRRAELYWLFIILLFAPIGAFIYFFVVKLREPPLSSVQPRPSLPPRPSAPPPGPSLEELKERAEQSPSVLNLLAYADAALEHKRLDEAVQTYEKILARDPETKEALHGLALALLEQEKTDRAVEYLGKLMDLDPRFRDFAAAIDYAEALWLDESHELALEVLQEVVKRSPRIPHRLLYANYLALENRLEEARKQLRTALDEYAESPPFVKRRDMASAKAAESLLAQLN